MKSDWDNAIEGDLESAYQDFKTACYGDRPLNPIQAFEVRQAFLSGVHWMNTHSSKYSHEEIERSVRVLMHQPKST